MHISFCLFFSLPVSQQSQVLVQATVTPIMVSDLLLHYMYVSVMINANWFTYCTCKYILTNDFFLYGIRGF